MTILYLMFVVIGANQWDSGCSLAWGGTRHPAAVFAVFAGEGRARWDGLVSSSSDVPRRHSNVDEGIVRCTQPGPVLYTRRNQPSPIEYASSSCAVQPHWCSMVSGRRLFPIYRFLCRIASFTEIVIDKIPKHATYCI